MIKHLCYIFTWHRLSIKKLKFQHKNTAKFKFTNTKPQSANNKLIILAEGLQSVTFIVLCTNICRTRSVFKKSQQLPMQSEEMNGACVFQKLATLGFANCKRHSLGHDANLKLLRHWICAPADRPTFLGRAFHWHACMRTWGSKMEWSSLLNKHFHTFDYLKTLKS